MYIYQTEHWPNLYFDAAEIRMRADAVASRVSALIEGMGQAGLRVADEAVVESIATEIQKSGAIEGERISIRQLRSLVASRLGIKVAGVAPPQRYVEGIVEMMLDATQRYAEPLTDERLFGWHNTLFPTGRSGLYHIDVGKYRAGVMQVVSGVMGREKVHYEAPPPDRVVAEMRAFLSWANAPAPSQPQGIIKAAEAHFRFVTIHPFDDGNGRIARAIAELLLSRADGSARRFYSMSAAIAEDRKNYYAVLERAQKNPSADISEWIAWFLTALDVAWANLKQF